MLEPAFDRDSVQRHVQGVRASLGSDALRAAVADAARQLPGDGDAAAKIAAALPDQAAFSSGGSPAEVPYFSRNPLVSLMQSGIEESLIERGVSPAEAEPDLWSKIVHTVERFLHLAPGTFTSDDPDWYLDIGKSALERLGRGNHAFNQEPATRQISDTARLVVVGDWGTGLPRARAVARLMQQEVAAALADGREAHAVHLGDVYYSGLPSEDKRRFLAFWPVTEEQAAAGVTSWSLNGNHDMYSGGFGYFGTLLADPRFAAQRSPGGEPTSYFRLTSDSWDFLGLDTAWDPDVFSFGESAVLQDPQAGWAAQVAAESQRKLVLFSHHQLTSVYDKSDVTPLLAGKLAPLLAGHRVTAWWWGHEHRAMAFRPHGGVRYPRCLGHGGVPILLDPALTGADRDVVEWDNRRYIETGRKKWTRFGFAVIDLDGAQLTVRYIDDDGTEIHREVIS